MRKRTIAASLALCWWLGGGCGPDLGDDGTSAANATATATVTSAGGSDENEVNGCTMGAAVDMSGNASVTINFGDTLGNAYDPPCVIVDAGTEITFSGDSFASHPLAGGVDGEEDPASPIPNENGDIPELSFTLADPGDYPYYCVFHEGQGMKGVIYVL